MNDQAIPRRAEPEVLPVIRSHELFERYDQGARREYFRLLGATPAENVAPEAVFGTNGWQRRLAEAGAEPSAAKAAFDLAWNSMTPEEREEMAYSEAADRYFMTGVQDDAAYAEQRSAHDLAVAMRGGSATPEDAMLMADNPAAATAALAETLFGRNPVALEA